MERPHIPFTYVEETEANWSKELPHEVKSTPPSGGIGLGENIFFSDYFFYKSGETQGILLLDGVFAFGRFARK